MAEIRVNPTRMELKKLKARLSTAKRGHKLLKDKCDELMKRFLDIIRENKVLRESVEERLRKAYQSLSIVAATSNPKQVKEALILPRNESTLHMGTDNLMSVVVPTFEVTLTSEAQDACCYGFAYTSGELDAALRSLGDMTKDMIRLAQYEKTAQMLAQEIERTRRRVNALEYIMMPSLTVAIKRITMKLDENERANITRLMKVKDMMVKAQIEAMKNQADEVY